MIKDIWRLLIKNPFTTASILSGFLWFGCLVAPGDTFVRPTYIHMAEVAPEVVWTWVFFITACLQFLRLTFQITPRQFPFEFGLKLWAAFLWTSVGLLCIISQWPLAAAMSDTIVISIFSIIDLLQVKPCNGCNHRRGHCSREMNCYYATTNNSTAPVR